MKNSNLTPFPWVAGVSKVDGKECFTVCQADNTRKVVAICGYVGAEDEAESIANVMLLGVAHLLFETLKECVTESGATCFHDSPESMKRRLDYISGIASNAIFQARSKPEIMQ